MEVSVLRLYVERVAYTKAIRAAALPWNQRRERRAAASTSELGRAAACLKNRPKPHKVSTQFDRLGPSHSSPCSLADLNLFDQTQPSSGPSAPNQRSVITFFRV